MKKSAQHTIGIHLEERTLRFFEDLAKENDQPMTAIQAHSACTRTEGWEEPFLTEPALHTAAYSHKLEVIE